MNNFKNVCAVGLTFSLIACGGSDDGDSGNTGYTQMNTNTLGAQGFAMRTVSSQSYSANQFSENHCDNLVRVTYVESEDANTVEPVFRNSNKNNCQISEVLTLNNHLVLRGQFFNLASTSGEQIPYCELVTMPLNDANGVAECLVARENSNDYRSVSFIKPTADGDSLLIGHRYATQNSVVEYAVSTWTNTGEVITGWSRFIDENRNLNPIADMFSYDGEHFYVAQYKDLGPLEYSHRDSGITEPFNDEFRAWNHGASMFGLDNRSIVFGELILTEVIHNPWVSGSYPDLGNIVINAAESPNGDPSALDLTLARVHLVDGGTEISSIKFSHYSQGPSSMGTVIHYVDNGAYYLGQQGFNFIHKDALQESLTTGYIDVHQIESGEEDRFNFNQYDVHTADTRHFYNYSASTISGDRDRLNYLDLNTGTWHKDNLLDNEIFDNTRGEIELKQYADGLVFTVNYTSGESKHIYFNQRTKTFSEDVLDNSEIGNTIPLYPQL
ncbi:hypothetical protein AB4402_08790 [Vibrio breoganii]|uniref:Lipoprotein n=1 Tax=Vibrio breoganii TaxID=553239 RepID=A0AAP8N0K7_9VIBR|nr:hypothetical protein [Vibrio breoganii]PMP14066.1 hypothetical protein BCS93_04565 [Vibrio breoganii]